jgi:hypothetical protein
MNNASAVRPVADLPVADELAANQQQNLERLRRIRDRLQIVRDRIFGVPSETNKGAGNSPPTPVPNGISATLKQITHGTQDEIDSIETFVAQIERF